MPYCPQLAAHLPRHGTVRPVTHHANPALDDACRTVLDGARVGGWRVPHGGIYPHQWLWDSGFHAVALVALGELDAALDELEALFVAQTSTGFVPHMTYHTDPDAAMELWGIPGRSTITQPPMYGHALAVLADAIDRHERYDLRGRLDVVAAKADAGLEWLLANRNWLSYTSLLVICHPWETGCDDSVRWDGWMDDGYHRATWGATKRQWAHDILMLSHDDEPAARANPGFAVADAGFNALVAFNCAELWRVTGREGLRLAAIALTTALDRQYDPVTAVWRSVPVMPDFDPTGATNGRADDDATDDNADRARLRQRSAAAPTLDGALGVLVTPDATRAHAALDGLVDPERFGAPYGPAGLWVTHPHYDPNTYWRGVAWPQLSYLCWLGARQWGRSDVADTIATATINAVLANDFAEYWNPHDATSAGATPQTWAAIVAAMTAP